MSSPPTDNRLATRLSSLEKTFGVEVSVFSTGTAFEEQALVKLKAISAVRPVVFITVAA